MLSKTVSLEDVTAKVQFSFGPQEMEADTKTIVIAMVMRLPFTPLQSVVLPNLVISRGILRLVHLPWQLLIGKLSKITDKLGCLKARNVGFTRGIRGIRC